MLRYYQNFVKIAFYRKKINLNWQQYSSSCLVVISDHKCCNLHVDTSLDLCCPACKKVKTSLGGRIGVLKIFINTLYAETPNECVYIMLHT